MSNLVQGRIQTYHEQNDLLPSHHLSTMKVESQSGFPKKKRIYRNHIFNSEAWNQFQVRADDIVITTPLKAGTTWMQTIVENLIFQNQTIPGMIWELSPWLDRRLGSPEKTLDLLATQQHRRCIKTHLPLDAIPWFPDVKYIYVGRDARDVFMSLWNQHRHLKPETIQAYNSFLTEQNFPPCPESIHQFFFQWISKSCVSWENEGFPYCSPLYHLSSWWEYRHLPNILFVHFNDLLTDLEGEMRRIATYLETPVYEPNWTELVENMTFHRMKKNADKIVPSGGKFLKGGAQRFLHKGTNDRWRGVLTTEELEQYEMALTRQLDPESRNWLELGR